MDGKEKPKLLSIIATAFLASGFAGSLILFIYHFYVMDAEYRNLTTYDAGIDAIIVFLLCATDIIFVILVIKKLKHRK